jgi:hypothetical protein
MTFIRLSSRLTFTYKLLIPLIGLVLLSGYTWLILAQHWLLELHGVIALGFLLLLAIFMLSISLRIRYVAYNESFIRIRNYGSATLIPIADYQLLTPAAFPFGLLYRLRTTKTSSLFLGSFTETLANTIQLNSVLNGFLEPSNVTIARKALSLKNSIAP